MAIPLGARVLTGKPVRRILARAFRRRPLHEWLRAFDRSQVPVAPVLPLTEALRDPQLAGRVVDPTGNAAPPFPFAVVPLGPAPRLGAHDEELLGARG